MSIWQKAVRFIGFSGLGWILDFIVYSILGIWFSNLVVNNFISSWVGVTFVFIFATRKVFENSSKVPLWAKYLIYIVYQFVLILCVSKLLGVIDVQAARGHRRVHPGPLHVGTAVEDVQVHCEDPYYAHHHDAELLRHAGRGRKTVRR